MKANFDTRLKYTKAFLIDSLPLLTKIHCNDEARNTHKREDPSWRARAHAKQSDFEADRFSMCPASPAWLTLSSSPDVPIPRGILNQAMERLLEVWLPKEVAHLKWRITRALAMSGNMKVYQMSAESGLTHGRAAHPPSPSRRSN
ncbi:hypothetical protein D5086_006471 [Populus alba]|uniref:Uncharacterized protein n=1 Tax=Populus alba TaxID=43335 RepID=A0ACC4CKN8_POPAL